ncbi:MAG: 7-carboxy-7-deazaguanine synthase QueE [Planctomycetota bacterium]|jgi:7-carboxy-7-deazaguanine synthase|nr:7-carboxy-7-deazaguanine synthase QueE [Planctomycetota bacterium]
MRIAEIYQSLQGEGLLAGTPSVFVRTSGCNLRCRWCDTPFTSWEPTGDVMSVADIVAAVESFDRRHVVVTGGEPLLFAETVALCRDLRGSGHHLTIETAGTVLPESWGDALVADLISISPKLASSGPPADTVAGWADRHAVVRRCDDVLTALMRATAWQMKFVIDTPEDLAEVTAWLADLGVGTADGAIFMMPQGVTETDLVRTTAWLAVDCRRLGYRVAHRHHIEWFGHTRAT